MKTLLTSLVTASFLSLAAFATNGSFNASDLVAVGFATGLVAWTVSQYTRTMRPLLVARPIPFPSAFSAPAVSGATARLAA